jgi:hypothetical protein
MNFEILTAGCRDPVVTGKCAMGVMIKTNRSGFSKTRHLIRPPPASSSFRYPLRFERQHWVFRTIYEPGRMLYKKRLTLGTRSLSNESKSRPGTTNTGGRCSQAKSKHSKPDKGSEGKCRCKIATNF